MNANNFYHVSTKGNIRRISFESWYRGMDKEISQKRPGLRTSYFDSLKQAQKAAEEQKALRAALEAESAKWAAEMAV